jgi:nucleoside-diphosphate-sugar epimerase
MAAYLVSKTEAEKAVWAYGDDHPELDISVCEQFPLTFASSPTLNIIPVNPSFLYGPLADAFPIPQTPGESRLSTNTHLFSLIYPDGSFPSISGYVDVRDVAKAHVLALKGHNPDPKRRKRFPLSSPHALNWDDVIAILAEKRPEIKHRLLSGPAPVYGKGQKVGFTDLKRIEEVTGLKSSEYHTLESTVLDTIDSLLELEKIWVANGHAIPTVTPR